MKNTFLTLAMIAFYTIVSAQHNKMFLSLEYSPNFTTATNEIGFVYSNQYNFANNIFIKSGYKLMNHLYANTGIGFLNTKDFHSIDFQGSPDLSSVELLMSHSYVVVPVGVTYFIRSLYFSPEIGIGWNTSNKVKHVEYRTDGFVIASQFEDEHNFYQTNTTTFPLFLTIGSEINFNSWSILLGAKGYYSLNTTGQSYYTSGHYYGIGILTGIKF